MRPNSQILFPLLCGVLMALVPAHADDGNRFVYLDEPCDPYYVHGAFPRLVTPQWAGEADVQAVVVLAIDDMRDTAKYEAYLRPILERLKRIDGRAPVSIMTCQIAPEDTQLQSWLDEGLSIECHTIDHPCPLLKDGDLEKAKSTYDRCVEQMAAIAGNDPVAFRVPCCDSQNTPSPRFWTEIFGRTTPAGKFLQVDSSVFNITTAQDSDLPRRITRNDDGRERFRRYLPFPSFVNTIEDYPYPYVIGRLCWEFPCMVPSDWEAQHVQQPNNPRTVVDLQRALDAVVTKQGVFNLVFHPHGWMRNDQVVELIDYAVERYGTKVKFLTFREAVQRINQHLLAGYPLRDTNGQDNGVRLLDLNQDGYLDVVVGNAGARMTRLWLPDKGEWSESAFPVRLDLPSGNQAVFGSFRSEDSSRLSTGVISSEGFHFYGDEGWTRVDSDNTAELIASWRERSALSGDLGIRLRDLDRDGNCELLISNPVTASAHRWEPSQRRWQPLPLEWPKGISLVDSRGRDAGLRFVDVNQDGYDDLVFSNAESYSVHLFTPEKLGWSRPTIGGRRNEPATGPVLPMIVRGDGTNNGAWFHSQTMWVQNEDTHRLPDLVDRARFERLSDPPTQVGAASIDITPSFPVRLSGYGSRTQEATRAAQRIWAKALATGEGDATAILINVENCGLTAEIRETVARQLAEREGLAAERLVITVTHTHTAPCLSNWAPYLFGADLPGDQQARIEQYTQQLTGQLVEVAQQALRKRQPGRLFWGEGTLGFAINRRAVRDGQWTGFGQQASGPVDHRLPILVGRSLSGDVLAIVANYACHCTTLGGDFNEIAGDWAGFAQEFMEQNHPGAVAMVTIGCGADANPAPRGDLDICRQQGRALADEVQRLLSSQLKPLSSDVECTRRIIALPFDTLPSREEWQKRANQEGAAGYHARKYLQRLEAGETLPATVDYPVASWCFGNDLAMVFLGGEVVVDYAIRLQAEFDAERLWITAYANDVPCYIPSRRILREGGYEAESSMIYYARPGRLASEVEDLIVDTVQKVVPPRFYSPQKKADSPPPKSPEAALRSMHVPDGAVIELVACEPLVMDPVAFDWGPDGRLWVVEMRDYPNGMGWNGKGDPLDKPGGRVKVLSDDDRDGTFDRATVFLDGLSYPTGVKVWRKGILVTAAPEILYAEDTDGDDRADKRETLYRGFGEGNQQHRVNGLRWGLDHWLHVGNGDSGGAIRSLKTGAEVDVSGRDILIAPDRGGLRAQSGQTQYGRCRDDYDNWFGGNNSHPVWHYVLSDHYLRRNPHVAAPSVRREIAVEPGAAPVFPASRSLARFNDFDRVDRFTSACSPLVFRDDQVSAREGHLSVYVCEPVHNLVHRSLIAADGVSFVSRRAEQEQESEFLASEDNWFRPVMVRTGPDGALWVADMYRLVIEHPTWIPESWQRKLDLRAGDERGRIYRIRFPGVQPRDLPRLDGMSTAELVAALDDPNGTRRDLVQQLLYWRHDVEAAAPLRELLDAARWPATPLHALYLLEELGALDTALLQRLIEQWQPELRIHAVRIAETRFAESPGLGEAALRWVGQPAQPAPADLRFQMQLAYSLGEWDDSRAARGIAELARRWADQPYIVAAAASSLRRDNLEVVAAALLEDGATPPPQMLTPILQTAAGLGDTRTLERGLAVVTETPAGSIEAWQLAALETALTSLEQHQKPHRLSAETEQAIGRVLETCRQLALGELESELPLRLAAIRLLGRPRGDTERNLQVLAALLEPQTELVLQRAAIEALAALPDASVPDRLLAVWSQLSPSSKAQSLDVLMERSAWTGKLVEALESGSLPIGALDARRRQQLMQHRDSEIASRAATLLQRSLDTNRQSLVDTYLSRLPESGNTTQGQQVFAKHCAKCHRFQNEGHAVGPDLAAIADKSPNAMLTAVLDPNRAVEDKYQDFIAVTRDGRQYSGVVIAETSNSITLSPGEGKSETLLRSRIDVLQSTGKSLMPEGLERELQPAEFADLIAYLSSVRPEAKSFAGNTPQVAPVRDDGSIRLFAMHSRIYGPSLVFEPHYRNLGFWQSYLDFAAWDVVAPEAGAYRVILDYSCDDSTAGNRFQLTVAGQTLGGMIEGTGGWDQFRSQPIGTVELPSGQLEVIVRSDGPVQGALMDLRTIRLHPVR